VVFDREYFKEMLKEKKLHQYELADLIGASNCAISNLATGELERINGVFLYKMAIIFDCQMEDLVKEI
jgi:DNA-binding Xre family transcriptional regulator